MDNWISYGERLPYGGHTVAAVGLFIEQGGDDDKTNTNQSILYRENKEVGRHPWE
jgi:hypothetical protein